MKVSQKPAHEHDPLGMKIVYNRGCVRNYGERREIQRSLFWGSLFGKSFKIELQNLGEIGFVSDC